jgi:hypothetical protein
MRRTLQLVLVPVGIAACVAGVADPAAAARADNDVVVTKATGDTEHVQVRGKVISDVATCAHNRRVSVWHDVDPGGRSPDDFRIGTVRSDDHGRWDIASVALPDKVYAMVRKNRHCKGDISPTVVVQFK